MRVLFGSLSWSGSEETGVKFYPRPDGRGAPGIAILLGDPRPSGRVISRSQVTSLQNLISVRGRGRVDDPVAGRVVGRLVPGVLAELGRGAGAGQLVQLVRLHRHSVQRREHRGNDALHLGVG